MPWVNIFELGAVDLFWVDSETGTRNALGTLPSGTVTVVDGVIQCRGLPENLDFSGVGGIVAVPQDPLLQAAQARIRVSNVRIPGGWDTGSTSQVYAGIASAPPDLDAQVSLAPLFDQAADEIVALTPDEANLGNVPAQASPLPELMFFYVEEGPA